MEIQSLIKLKMLIGARNQKFKLDPTLNWKFAEITDLKDAMIEFYILDSNKNEGYKDILKHNNLKMGFKKKQFLKALNRRYYFN